VAYTAQINIAVKGQAAVNALQKSITELGQKIDDVVKRRVGPSTALETFTKQLREAEVQLTKVAAGTSAETQAVKNYVTALGNQNAAIERQNGLISDEIKLRESVTGQVEKLNKRQQEFTDRTNAAAQAAHRQTAEFIRQQRIAKEVANLNRNAPAAQLLLPAATPGTPAMGGGARRRITGPVERLGGARTADEAAMALRYAQALKEQVRPLSQIQSLYAGISQAAAQTARIKALPDSAMLNTAGRGIQQLELSQDRYNRELAESAQRLQQVDRLEASRQRRAAKLQGIADYYTNITPSLMQDAGFGLQGPALPPRSAGGLGRPGRQMASPIGGTPSMAGSPAAQAARTKQLENVALGAGFPLLFGGGVGQVAGGILGSFVGTGFGGQIIGSALLGQVEQLVVNFNTISEATKNLNMDALKDSAIFINKELDITVQRLKEAGRVDEARKLVAEEIAKQTGVLPDLATKYNKNSTLLANTWNKFLAAAGGFATIITGPTVAGLTILLSGFTKILQYSNALASSIANWGFSILNRVISRFQFLKDIIDRIRNNTSDQSEEEQAARLQEVKDTLDANQKVRSSYLERFKTQQDNILLTRKLNGEMLGDYIRQAELEKELTKNNEERYAVLRQIQDIRAKGGVAAGLVSAADISALENKLKELENKKIELQIQIKEESLKKFEEDIKRSADAATRNLDLQANAIQGRATVQQSEFTLMKSINDLQLQRLSFEEQLLNKAFEQTGNYDQQLAILTRLEQIVYQRFNLNVANAKVERAASIAQLKTGIDLLRIEYKKQQVQLQRLRAVAKEAQAQGLLNQAHIEAVDAQAGAVELAGQSLDFAIENAKVQERIVNAVYDQKVEAAGFARNMELAAIASRRTTVLNQRASNGSGGFQIGRRRTGPSFEVPANAIKKMARGGYVTRPTFAIVGEGGEPEFVVPQSKASAFAENWMAGRRGAEAIPRMSGSASDAPPSINITTGPVMQQGGQNYVTIQDMEAGLQAVADTILNNSRSYSARRFTGVS